MRDYLWQLIALAIVCGICTRLAPGGDGGFGRPMRLLCGVCLALLLLSPVKVLADGGVQLGEAIWSLIDTVQQQSEAQETQPEASYARLEGDLAAYQIREALCAEFSLKSEQVHVSVRLTAQGDAVALVRIGLQGEAIWCDSHALETWVQDVLGCEATVYIE